MPQKKHAHDQKLDCNELLKGLDAQEIFFLLEFHHHVYAKVLQLESDHHPLSMYILESLAAVTQEALAHRKKLAPQPSR